MLTSYPGFARCVAILRYTFMRVRMEFGRNKIFYGRSKVENGRTKWIVLGQIVHALFISNFILCKVIKFLGYTCIICIQDVCVCKGIVYIRQNSVHGLPKLLVV